MALTAFDDRNIIYGELKSHYLRIGDTQLFVPPTSISVHREMKNERVSLIRGRNSLPKESGYFDRIITMTLFFPDIESINFELRPLLAQAKKCPFLPIENTYLNDAHMIEAITIQHITVQTTPGFPNTLQAIIQCYAFEPSTYIYGSSERSFDEMFNWPLFRWYYERNLEENKDRDSAITNLAAALGDEVKGLARFNTYYEPLTSELTNDIVFRIAAEDDLEAIKDWNKEKKELVSEWVREKNKTGFTSWLKNKKKMQENFNEEYDEIYERAKYEHKLSYEDWDLGRMYLQDFSISFENTISSHQLQMHQSPTHQYLGSQDTVIVAKFTSDDMDTIASLENLMRRTSYLTREYHKEMTNGFLEIDHQLTRLFGVKNVIIDDLVIDTVEGAPEMYDITLTLMAYNRAEKKMHEVEAMTLDLNWDIKNNDMMPPYVKDVMKYFSKSFGGLGLSTNAKDQAIYNAWVIETFKGAELYPDLELPTYDEVKAAGFSIKNTNDGYFVDPDFFIMYDDESDFSKILANEIQREDAEVQLSDATGGTAILSASGIELDKKAEDTSKRAKEITRAGKPDIQASEDISTEANQKNYEASSMEALIRKSASRYGLIDVYPVAFVKSFDTQLRHFYKTGVNDLGDVSVSQANIPIIQNTSFQYRENTNQKYIGVMRVSNSYGNQINSRRSIEYNVDLGIRYMTYSWNYAGKVIQSGEYNLDNITKIFPNDEVTDNEIQYLIMTLTYLELDDELNHLLANGSSPSAMLTDLLNKALESLREIDPWDLESINEEYDKLPIKDYKAKVYDYEESDFLSGLSDMSEDDYNKSDENNLNIERSMMHDMVEHDRRGRLVRAFPTFFMTFIDEGQFIGTVKMSDQYFNYQAVSDITYNNSRKQAASTLICELSNVFGSLSDHEKAMDLTTTSMSDLFLTAIMPGAVARETERTRLRNPEFYNSIYLRTGVRVHMRMGYGSNAANLPTMMNGTITSLKDNGQTITMLAQNDGVELTDPLNGMLDLDPEDETTGFMANTKEPTEIIDELLTDSRGMWANISAKLSNKEYQNHSLGIMHFGETGPPQGWENFRNMKSLGLFPVRETDEINMNIHRTTGLMNAEQDKWYRRIQDGFGMGEGDESGLNINLFDKTVWDVLNIVAAVGPDMMTAVHPFGLRNTIFLGKPYFPIHYDYTVDLEGEKVTGTKLKTFQQLHVYDSYTTIIHNGIEATEKNLYTVAVGSYMNEGKVNTTRPVYVDTDIWPEKQRTVNIDTTINAKGVWLASKVPLVGTLMNKGFKKYYDEGVALKITAAGLRDFMKDMYDGYLTVMGDPTAKPYDVFLLQDHYSRMGGPANIKEVVHIMNEDVGFISMIKPDAITINTDQNMFMSIMRSANIVTAASLTMLVRSLLASRGYKGALPILNALWSGTVNVGKRSFRRFNENKFIKKGKELYRTRVHPKFRKKPPVEYLERKSREFKARHGGTPMKDILKWKKNGMFDEVNKLFKGVGSDRLEKILTSVKGSSSRNRILRRMNPNNLSKIKNFSSSALRVSSKATSGVLRGGRWVSNILRTAWKGKHILAGPFGVVTFLLETAVVSLLTATIGEAIDRHLMSRQAVMIMPLKKDGVGYTSGINGNKGSVIASPADLKGKLGPVEKILMKLMGEDTSEENNDPFDITMAAQSNLPMPANPINDKKQESIKSTLDTLFKPVIQEEDDGKILEYYERDLQAAKEEWESRLKLHDDRSQAGIDLKYDHLKEQEEKTQGILDALFNLFRGDSSTSGSMCVDGDFSLDGKAVNLSSYFGKLGPMIEAEAKRQGMSQYTEILKAKCMQESSGNYIRTPDVFQASESLGLPRNSIGLERSLQQGIKYFGQVVKQAGGDIRLALQSYNFGSGFIGYVNRRGGKWTQELTNSFSNMMASRMGWRRYGDKNYVKNVLRYYESSTENCVSGADDAPEVLGSAGQAKYKLTGAQGRKVLINPRDQKDRQFNIYIVPGGGSGLMRKGTYEVLNEIARKYKAQTGGTLVLTSAHRTDSNTWHGTGYAVDVDTPNTMRRLSNGKFGFPPGKNKENARKLTEIAIQSGIGEIWFGDYSIGQEMKKKYPGIRYIYDPKVHHNHIHLSYPNKK